MRFVSPIRSITATFIGLAVATSAPTHAESYKMIVPSTSNDIVVRYNFPAGNVYDHIVGYTIGNLNRPTNALIGPDGAMYVVSRDNDLVLRYDAQSGEFLSTFITVGSSTLNDPIELVFHEGYAYVSSAFNGRVIRYDATSGVFAGIAVTGGSGELSGPHGLVFGPDGDLYVASYSTNSVKRYDTSTFPFTYVGDFVTANTSLLAGPIGVVFDDAGRLLVSGLISRSVVAYSGVDGTPVETIVPSGAQGVEPRFIRFGIDGDLYVASGVNNQVYRVNMESLEMTPVLAAGPAGLSTPWDVLFVEDQIEGDLDGDGQIGPGDLAILLGKWGLGAG